MSIKLARHHSSSRRTAHRLRQDKHSKRQLLICAVSQAFFRPELLNRMDEVVCFRPLDAPAVRAVTGLLAADTASRLLEQRQMRLEVSPGLIEHIAAAGYNQVCCAAQGGATSQQ